MSDITTMHRADIDPPTYVTGQTLPRNSHACPNREAGLLGLSHSKPEYFDRLLALSPGEWRKVQRWLDASGLTLYFADRVNELNLQSALPVAVNQRLQQYLSDNRARTKRLLQECAELQRDFQQANLSYALSDGFSLCPTTVSMWELRTESCLDLLIDQSSASEAREILEQAGYGLGVMAGGTWTFKKNEKQNLAQTIVLHIETVRPGRKSALSRREIREIEGIIMPVLAPADLFVRQGMHVFREACSSFLRASHLLEFYRTMCAHRDDPNFWSEVRGLAEEDATVVLGLGVVLQLIESVMQGEIPSKLSVWTTLPLPAGVQRWIAIYGLNCVYGTPPGTKLYLLLQRELEKAGMVFTRVQPQSLQFRLILPRLRFHIVRGPQYAWASYRWRQYRNELAA